MPTHVTGEMGEGRATLEEHHNWCLKLWNRMDRDQSGSITRKELDCEEFREVLRFVITPHAAAIGTGGAGYARVVQNVEQAMDFCLRKADFNATCVLTFDEFKAFLRILRSKQDSAHTANLIFALFDLDGDNRISESEFKEVYRYYLGHTPTIEEFTREWRILDAGGYNEVTRDDYIKWLQTSTNPIFKQHAPPVRGFGTDAAGTLNNIGMKSTSQSDASKLSRTLPGLDELSKSGPFRSRWNQNFNTKKNGNHELPAQLRAQFSKPQSLPELERYYEIHRGYAKNLDTFKVRPEIRRHKGILTTDSAPSLIPSRDVPGGTMRNPLSGRKVKWNDHWQEPHQMKKRIPPVTLLFQCPGLPPKSLIERTEPDR